MLQLILLFPSPSIVPIMHMERDNYCWNDDDHPKRCSAEGEEILKIAPCSHCLHANNNVSTLCAQTLRGKKKGAPTTTREEATQPLLPFAGYSK